MSSNKLDMMYNFVQSKLKNVTSTMDLLPFINSLMTLKNLKIQLSMALHQCYIDSKSEVDSIPNKIKNNKNPITTTKNNKNNIHYTNKNQQSNPNYITIQSLFFQLQRWQKNQLSFKQLPNHTNNKTVIDKKQAPKSLFQDAIIDNHCLSSTSCIALHRIIKALLYYNNILNKYNSSPKQTETFNKLLITYFNNNNYKHLLNDYNHICIYHINKSTNEFQLIYTQIIKYIQFCDITKCNKFRRNHRIRELENIKILNCNTNNIYLNWLIETLDSIHCHLLHSFDIGMRVNYDELELKLESESENKNNKNLKNKKLRVDNNEFYHDIKLESLKSYLNNKLLPLNDLYIIHNGQNKYFNNLNDECITIQPKTFSPKLFNGEIFNYHKQRKFETIINEIIPHLNTNNMISNIIKWLIEYIECEEFIDEDAIRLDLDDKEYSDICNSMKHHILREDIFNNSKINNNQHLVHQQVMILVCTFKYPL